MTEARSDGPGVPATLLKLTPPAMMGRIKTRQDDKHVEAAKIYKKAAKIARVERATDLENIMLRKALKGCVGTLGLLN
jgi:hypothetical protein